MFSQVLPQNSLISDHESLDFTNMLKSQTNTIDISKVQMFLLITGFRMGLFVWWMCV